MTKSKNVQDVTLQDVLNLPEGEPILKWKQGMFYRPRNSGYTNHVMDAGFYTREECIKYCFDSDGNNGKSDVYAMPLSLAMEQNYISAAKIVEYQSKLEKMTFTKPPLTYDTMVF